VTPPKPIASCSYTHYLHIPPVGEESWRDSQAPKLLDLDSTVSIKSIIFTQALAHTRRWDDLGLRKEYLVDFSPFFFFGKDSLSLLLLS